VSCAAAKATRFARLRVVRSRKESFDSVAGGNEISSPCGSGGGRGVQLRNAAQALGVRRPKQPLAGGTFWNHHARIHQRRPRAMCNFARCAGYLGLDLPLGQRSAASGEQHEAVVVYAAIDRPGVRIAAHNADTQRWPPNH